MRKTEREGEDKRIEREEKQVRPAVISRSSVSCDTMGTKSDNHPKATFFVEVQCLLKGLAGLHFTKHFNFIYKGQFELKYPICEWYGCLK